jgi:predicted unusual protein kinase regulating ubiquinone biosynthesis (AarF/ABC1/UbiB family)
VKVRFELSTSRVLVTEMIEGIPLLRIVRAVRRRDHAWLADLAARGHSLERISRNIYWNMFNQVFRDGFFHADLHPANLFVLADDRIGYVDYGIVGRLSSDLQKSLRAYIRNLVRGDFDGAIDELLKRMVPGLTTDMNEMRRELTAVLEDYRYGAAGQGQGAAPMQVSSAFVLNVMGLACRHDLTMSHGLTLYFKALLTTDAVVYELAPGYDVFSDLKKFFAGELIEDIGEQLSMPRALYEVAALGHRSALLLADLGRIEEVGRSLEVSLDTLRTMLVFYGLCALAAGSAAVVLSRADAFASFSAQLGFNAEWVTNGLYLCAALLMGLMWRQGRRVRLVLTRREASRQEGFDRSMGA